MRLPKPKSGPGLLLYGVSLVALGLVGRVLWVLVGQNVETVSAEKGYDKLLARHWGEIMNWLGHNSFWLSLVTAAFLGGTLALWAYIALQAKEALVPHAVAPPPIEPPSKYENVNVTAAIRQSTYNAGHAIGEGTAKAAELALPGIRSTLLSIKKHHEIPIPALEAPTARKNVEVASKYLVEIGPLLSAGHIAEAKEKAQELTGQSAAPRYVPVPPPPPPDKDGFDYPYPKAVLQLEIMHQRGQLSAQSDGIPYLVETSLTLLNKHKKTLRDCSILLREWTENGQRVEIGDLIKVGGETTFNVETNNKHFRFITRDISDKASKPPFLLRLGTRTVPLLENCQYVMALELQSRYPHPTLVGLQVDVGTGLEIALTILDQVVAPQ